MMKKKKQPLQIFNIVAVIQSGRLEYEAALLAASLRHTNPDFAGKLYFMQPKHNHRWSHDPTPHNKAVLDLLAELGAEIISFENHHFGEYYPYGNKIECLAHLPDEPFLFLDTDTLITGSFDQIHFDFSKPSASMRREGTWPEIELYGPNYTQTWRSLYHHFGLEFENTLDLSQPDEYWKRYMYFNAGWFFYQSPHEFGRRFLHYARDIRDNPPAELICQIIYPWLDQIALPLVIHSLGGGRPGPELNGLDGDVTCHWRSMSLLYARESDLCVKILEEAAQPNLIKRVLKEHEPFKRMIYQNRGHKARDLFNRNDLPPYERMIRNTLKRKGLWAR